MMMPRRKHDDASEEAEEQAAYLLCIDRCTCRSNGASDGPNSVARSRWDTDLLGVFPVAGVLSVVWGLRSRCCRAVSLGLGGGLLFIDPIYAFLIPSPADQIGLLVFLMTGFGVICLAHSQRRARTVPITSPLAPRIGAPLSSIGISVPPPQEEPCGLQGRQSLPPAGLSRPGS